MKTLLFIVVSATMLLSGCKSKEEKANELIKDDMFKVLYDFASYEPIETKSGRTYLKWHEKSHLKELVE